MSAGDILSKFQEGVRNVTALSLATGIPSEVAVPHLVIDAFKNLAAIGLTIGYTFKQLASASSAPAKQAPAKTETKADSKKAPEPVKVEEPVEEDVDMGGLFD